LNALNVENLYKCKRAAKDENGGEIPSFICELGPFWWFTKKSKNFGPLLNIFQLFRAFKGMVITFYSFLKK